MQPCSHSVFSTLVVPRAVLAVTATLHTCLGYPMEIYKQIAESSPPRVSESSIKHMRMQIPAISMLPVGRVSQIQVRYVICLLLEALSPLCGCFAYRGLLWVDAVPTAWRPSHIFRSISGWIWSLRGVSCCENTPTVSPDSLVANIYGNKACQPPSI